MKAVTKPGVHYTGEIHVKLRETAPVARLSLAHTPRRRTLTAIARSAGVRAVGSMVDALPTPGHTHRTRLSADLPHVEPGGELSRWHTVKPLRGLQPQPRDDVSWALLKLLGVGLPATPAGSQVDADQIEWLWATHTAGVPQAVQASISPVVSERLRARLELP